MSWFYRLFFLTLFVLVDGRLNVASARPPEKEAERKQAAECRISVPPQRGADCAALVQRRREHPAVLGESPIPLRACTLLGEGFEDASLRSQRPGAACVSHMGGTYHDSNRNTSAATKETRRHVGAPRCALSSRPLQGAGLPARADNSVPHNAHNVTFQCADDPIHVGYTHLVASSPGKGLRGCGLITPNSMSYSRSRS